MRALNTGVLVAAAVALGGGCRVYSEPEYATGYVELSSAPVDLSIYPSTYYEGRTVYLVNDRWMYPDRGRWVYYRTEPPQLYRQRTIIQQAPPAYGYPRGYPPPAAGYPYPQHRGPGGPVGPPPYAPAPPATRIP